MLKILQGDALTKLRELPDESVQCCVTSPPFWGLRDYGTAKWEGGDADCDHAKDRSNGIASSSFSDGSVFTRCDFRNKRTVWTVTTKPYPEAHFATYPHDLAV